MKKQYHIIIVLTCILCIKLAKGSELSDSVKVYNAGVNGNTTANLLARIDRDVTGKQPELVILMAGTNDMLHTNKNVSIKQYATQYQQLISTIRKKSDLIMMTIPPIYSPYVIERKPQFNGDQGAMSARIDSANQVIRQLAASNNIVLIDLHNILVACGGANTDKEGLFQNEANAGVRDGVHPNANGYKVIAAAVYQTIVNHKPGVQSVVCFGDSITNGYRLPGQGKMEGENYPAFLNRMLNFQ